MANHALPISNDDRLDIREDVLARYQRAKAWYDAGERMHMQKDRYNKLQRHFHWIMEYTEPDRLPLDGFDLPQLNLHYKGFNQVWRALSPAIRNYEKTEQVAA